MCEVLNLTELASVAEKVEAKKSCVSLMLLYTAKHVFKVEG